jgi:predicted enzyme related to lactoylglutathione lyase
MDCAAMVTNLNSADPERLIAFYRDVVGLRPAFDFAPGAFAVGPADAIALLIEGHDALAGVNGEPARVLLNFVVVDAVGEQRRLEAHGVHFVRAAYEEPGVGVFATFADPDGNYCQLAQLGAS